MITVEELKKQGYKEVTGSASRLWPDSDLQYQRAITDWRGIKYNITMVHYPALGEIPESWMAEVRTHTPFYTFRMHRVNDIDAVETNMEIFWRAMKCKHHQIR